MKKMVIAMLAMGMSLTAAVTASAGAFEHYYDYENPDGSYSYYFEQGQGVFVTIDKNWYQNTFVKTDDSGATFYHRDSYEAWAAEGIEGAGRLFRLGACVDDSFQDLPSFEYIGFDEEEAMNYYAQLPTDYQGYEKDETIRTEYSALQAQVRDVIAGITIGSKPEFDTEPETAGRMSGGWEITEDATLTDELMEIFRQAVQDSGDVKYEPVALLAEQVVAGMNYCFLCRETSDDAISNPSWCLLYVWKAPGKDAVILEAQPIGFGLSEQS